MQWPIRKLPREVGLVALSDEAASLARSIGSSAASLDVTEASYEIGVVYTSAIPQEIRTSMGAYYTPPQLCERLLDMASECGVDWSYARILDPACGGGAFLIPLVLRMVKSLRGLRAESVLESIQDRLTGYELDPFAAWMSEVFLDIALASLYRETGRRIESVVHVCDTLFQATETCLYDLVVGNPPYGRVSLSDESRRRFKRSLFGHANLYGLFTDMALRFANSNGVIAFVTPTSFLSGEYFKALRHLLGQEAPPAKINFIAERKGVFKNVLQETMLATYCRGKKRRQVQVQCVAQGSTGSFWTSDAGLFKLPVRAEEPWLIPRTERQSELIEGAIQLPFRLADYGYKVCTGPLVWNRHRNSLRDGPSKTCYPLIWAESVRSDGSFEFRAEQRNHKPYFEPTEKEHWVVTSNPCVLLQRTTAKEQCRRLVAAEIPKSFIETHGAVVIENHLNMIKPLDKTPKVKPAVVAALLNSEVVDQVFRCINGSVAVSAYELHALPLPSPDDINALTPLVSSPRRKDQLNRALERLYFEATE